MRNCVVVIQLYLISFILFLCFISYIICSDNGDKHFEFGLDYSYKNESLQYCYNVLERVSRSFAMVIQQLPTDIRDSICIFYLILRVLDSIEDDMHSFHSLHQKCNLLDNFHQILDNNIVYSLKGIGDKPQYRELSENFTNVLNVYSSLQFEHQQIIQNITKKMAFGMSTFVVKQSHVQSKQTGNETCINNIINTRILTLAEYCYYVAGCVGNGLSEIFSQCGLEKRDFHLTHEKIAVDMGLFLQKTNITRDYIEDINEGRIFWPNEILSKYVDCAVYLKSNPTSKSSLQCLNYMVYNALQHIEGVIEYLSDLQNESIFKFCAVPQIMAIATLEKCYNNSNVFKKQVKINRLLSLQIMMECNNIKSANNWFRYFLHGLNDKIDFLNDTNAQKCNDIIVKSLLLINDVDQTVSN